MGAVLSQSGQIWIEVELKVLGNELAKELSQAVFVKFSLYNIWYFSLMNRY